MLTNSRIFPAKVTHIRFFPVKNSFRYSVSLYAFDLDELSVLSREYMGFSYNAFNFFSIHDKDYLKGKGSLKEKLMFVLAEYGEKPQDIDHIELFTSPKFLGYTFNPVSFFLCYRQNKLICMIVEVNNTFYERHVYIMSEKDLNIENSSKTIKHSKWTKVVKEKSFHVSPFNDVLGDYEFYFQREQEHFDMNISIVKKGKKTFHARIFGDTIPFTKKNFYYNLFTYPLTAWLPYPRILWQAFKLYFLRRLRVYTKPHPESTYTLFSTPAKWTEKLSQKFVLRTLNKIVYGTLSVTLPTGEVLNFEGSEPGPHSDIHIKSSRLFRSIVLRGDVGFGESFVLGDWESSDVTRLLKLFALNRESLEPRSYIWGAVARKFDAFMHYLRPNTIHGSKKNIEAHYDLSNDMFQSFLDPTMSYSSGLYKTPEDSLEQSQLNKIDRILEQAEIQKDDHVLEIGCGWGGLAIRAVERYGCTFTCLTLSSEQKAYAEQKVKEAGLDSRISIRLEDYRKIEGNFDKVISIEMIEAVGKDFLGKYFKKCQELVKENGKIIIQVITMPHSRISRYEKSCDWIQKYIFPGCFVPSKELLEENIAEHTNLKIVDMYKMKNCYEKTLASWSERFRGQISHILQCGFDMNFVRKWIYYFCYCEAGFATEVLNTYQVVLSKDKK